MTVTNVSTTCSQTADVTVSDPSITITENVDQHKNATCNGGVGYLSVSVTGRQPGHSYTYEWRNTSDAAPAWVSTGIVPSINTAYAGVWEVKVTTSDLLCQQTLGGMVITEPTALEIKKTITDVVGCYGDKTGQIAFSVTGGVPPYTVTLTNGATVLMPDQSSASNFIFKNLAAGNTYKITVVDANKCSKVEENIEIKQPSLLTFLLKNTLTCGLNTFNQRIYVENLTGVMVFQPITNTSGEVPMALLCPGKPVQRLMFLQADNILLRSPMRQDCALTPSPSLFQVKWKWRWKNRKALPVLMARMVN